MKTKPITKIQTDKLGITLILDLLSSIDDGATLASETLYYIMGIEGLNSIVIPQSALVKINRSDSTIAHDSSSPVASTESTSLDPAYSEEEKRSDVYNRITVLKLEHRALREQLQRLKNRLRIAGISNQFFKTLFSTDLHIPTSRRKHMTRSSKDMHIIFEGKSYDKLSNLQDKVQKIATENTILKIRLSYIRSKMYLLFSEKQSDSPTGSNPTGPTNPASNTAYSNNNPKSMTSETNKKIYWITNCLYLLLTEHHSHELAKEQSTLSSKPQLIPDINKLNQAIVNQAQHLLKTNTLPDNAAPCEKAMFIWLQLKTSNWQFDFNQSKLVLAIVAADLNLNDLFIEDILHTSWFDDETNPLVQQLIPMCLEWQNEKLAAKLITLKPELLSLSNTNINELLFKAVNDAQNELFEATLPLDVDLLSTKNKTGDTLATHIALQGTPQMVQFVIQQQPAIFIDEQHFDLHKVIASQSTNVRVILDHLATLMDDTIEQNVEQVMQHLEHYDPTLFNLYTAIQSASDLKKTIVSNQSFLDAIVIDKNRFSTQAFAAQLVIAMQHAVKTKKAIALDRLNLSARASQTTATPSSIPTYPNKTPAAHTSATIQKQNTTNTCEAFSTLIDSLQRYLTIKIDTTLHKNDLYALLFDRCEAYFFTEQPLLNLTESEKFAQLCQHLVWAHDLLLVTQNGFIESLDLAHLTQPQQSTLYQYTRNLSTAMKRLHTAHKNTTDQQWTALFQSKDFEALINNHYDLLNDILGNATQAVPLDTICSKHINPKYWYNSDNFMTLLAANLHNKPHTDHFNEIIVIEQPSETVILTYPVGHDPTYDQNAYHIDYFFDPQLSTKDSNKQNCIEIINALNAQPDQVRVLFPYNPGGGHWCTGEIIIRSDTDNALLNRFEITAYNPMGGDALSDAEFASLEATL